MMWLTIAFGYCVACWLIGFFMIRVVWAREWEETVAEAGDRNVYFEWFCLLLVPILMPYCLWVVVRSVVEDSLRLRQLRRFSRTYREYEFVKVNNLFVVKPIRQQFEAHTPHLIHLGYDLLGDFKLKPEPIEVHDRFFLSPDGETLAAICALLDTGSVCLISVLEDGTCVDTCSSENPHPERTVESADRRWVSYLPDASMEELHAHHVNTLRELCARIGSSVMRFGKDQFRQIVIYDQRVGCRWRFRHGGLDTEPPAPDIDSLRPGTHVSEMGSDSRG